MAALLPLICAGATVSDGQSIPASPPEAVASSSSPAHWTAEQDHRQMMEQLGIKSLRPGPSGQAGSPNAANYDPAKADPFPDLPDPLMLKNGQKVTAPEVWQTQRRAEIVEDFEREVYGRIPPNAPKVTWSVAAAVEGGWIGGQRANGQTLIGHADNSACPEIAVDIRMILVMPAHAKAPVPVLIMFGGSRDNGLPRAADAPAPPANPPRLGASIQGLPSTELLLAAGWGYALLNPGSIQADNGAGLTKGIIGLANKGQPRHPDDWGALRAWAWGASRALDYLETNPAADAKKVGIEGVSRFGKAALVTMAFDQRFAVALIGSSGEGGAKLHRRNFGEAVESLTGTGEYHWMAGNFLKYDAAESSFGSRNAGDLLVDSHELIALCAPRSTFISYGVPERGDANWLDQQGSYMATVAAGPVFRLLGAKDLGETADYRTAKMPPVNVGLLDSALAWRQHDGGHEDRSNMPSFLAWANERLQPATPPEPAVPSSQPPAAAASSSTPAWHGPSAAVAAPRRDANFMTAHEQLVAKAKAGGIDLYFLGDSITRRWGCSDPAYAAMLENWKANFFGWNAGDFGWGGDGIQHMLWRIQNGELDGVNPKAIVILAGTNNVGAKPGGEAKVADILQGIRALIEVCQQKAPGARIILTAIFPRNDSMAVLPEIGQINEGIAKLCDGQKIFYLNVNDKLAGPDGTLLPGMTVDKLHLTIQGYQVWADGLRPLLTQLMGPPASIDHAPPPTGDPQVTAPKAGK